MSTAPSGEAGERLPSLPCPPAALPSTARAAEGVGELPHSKRRNWAQPHGAGRGQLGLSQPEEHPGLAGTSPTSPKLAFNQSWLHAASCRQPFGSPLQGWSVSAQAVTQPVQPCSQCRRARKGAGLLRTGPWGFALPFPHFSETVANFTEFSITGKQRGNPFRARA